MSRIIAIDGPAGSGKSSVSKEVARRRGFGYLDTGAAYRVLTLAGWRAGIDLDDETEVVGLWQGLGFAQPTDPDQQRFALGPDDVSGVIREEWLANEVSRVAKHPAVRVALNTSFRDLANRSDLPAMVVEGRDITTVVAPDAPVRILLTADEVVRIARRERELGHDASALVARDARDGEVVEFLRPTEGVTLVDSTDLDFEQTVAAVLAVVDRSLGPVTGGQS